MSCSRCNTSTYLLDDFTNGCIVCTNCGNVVNNVLCIDEAFYDKAADCMSHSLTNELDSKFQLSTAKLKSQSNVSFFSHQDAHTLKLVHFKKRFDCIFQATQLHESISTEARLMYLDFESKYSLKGRNLDIVICAFIFMACQKKQYAMNIKIFGEEFITDIMKCVKFIEESTNVIKIVEAPSTVFHDDQIEAFIRKYAKFVNINRKFTQEIVKLIPKAEFIMRKKEIIAVALIAYYKKDKTIVKALSKECCISELAIKTALREIVA